MKKKVISLTLATALVLGGEFSTFAADSVVSTPDTETGAYKADVTVTTETKTPTIKITVPTDAKITLNTYGLKVGDAEDKIDVTLTWSFIPQLATE